MDEACLTIAVIGGTGALGSGLATRWARGGLKVIVGSRDAEKADHTAQRIRMSAAPGNTFNISGTDNLAAARAAQIVVLSVPHSSHHDVVDEIAGAVEGKILVVATVPLQPPKVETVQMPLDGAVAASTQKKLGSSVRVVSAFQNVSAALLHQDNDIDCDVLVCGDDRSACEEAIGLAARANLKAYYAGPVANSVATEALTSLLIVLNRNHKIHSGIRITGFH